jgi:hypothetical protein
LENREFKELAEQQGETTYHFSTHPKYAFKDIIDLSGYLNEYAPLEFELETD